jgi:hypothetical protein
MVIDMADNEKLTSIAVSTGTAAGFSGTGAHGVALAAPPENHPIYSMVGKIASDWAHVEHMFDLIIADLAAIEPKILACITAQMTGVYPRCKAIIALLTLVGQMRGMHMGELVAKTEDIMHRSGGPSDKRNRAVHDPWLVYLGASKTAQFKAMPFKDLRYGIHDVDRTDLEKTLVDIGNFHKRVTDLKNAISAKLKTA